MCEMCNLVVEILLKVVYWRLPVKNRSRYHLILFWVVRLFLLVKPKCIHCCSCPAGMRVLYYLTRWLCLVEFVKEQSGEARCLFT